jgi:DNA-binding response OmpR family regulator
VRILVVEDDPTSRELLRRLITARTPHQVTAVDGGAKALALIMGDAPFDVVLLDWVLPDIAGPEVCRSIRSAPLAVQPYVALVTGKNMRHEMLEGLSAGADDFLPKPVAPDELLGRLEVAARRLGARGSGESGVLPALIAARERGDGELVVTGGDLTARIFFHTGKVAWVHLSDDSSALLHFLEGEAELRADDVREVVAECRRTGARLTDTLVAFGLLDRASLRVSILQWTRRQLEAVRAFPEPRTLFVPKKRHYAEELLFDLDELLPGAGRATRTSELPLADVASRGPVSWASAFALPPDAAFPADLTDLVERCLEGDGVTGAAVIDRATGVCLAYRGTGLSADIAWAHIHALNVIARHERVEEAVVVTATHFHFIRLRTGSDHLVYAVVNANTVLLAMARVALQRAIDGWQPAEPS